MKVDEWNYRFWKERNSTKFVNLESLGIVITERESIGFKILEFENEYQRTWILVEH